MAIQIVTGLPGSSKSYDCTVKADEWIRRNRRWYQRTGVIRPVRSNLEFSDDYTRWANSFKNLPLKLPKGIEIPDRVKEWNQHHKFLEYWEDPEELPLMNDCDVIWEEMGAHVDSRSWEQLPFELRRWLQQHRHRGVNIYGNCQDFADVDVAVRRLVSNLYYLVKVMGSRDPSPTTPPPSIIWGLVLKFQLSARSYDEKNKFKGMSFWPYSYEWLSRHVISRYSMFNDVKQPKQPPLRHTERKCLECGEVKIKHV